MRISMRSWETACRLLQEVPAADMHLDLPGELLFRHRCGERQVIGRRYLPVWRRAGICLIGAAVYLEEACLPEMGLRNALLQIEALQEEVKELEGEVHLVRSRKDLERAFCKSSVGIVLYLEGLDFIGADTGLLTLFSELGVQGASLAWSRRNVLACGCCRASEHTAVKGGITELGLQAIHKMEALHMFLDISHLNDDGMQDALAETELPVLATHSNARAVHFHYRNLTDGQIMGLSARGGVIGLNACSLLTGSYGNGKHLELLCRHGAYLAETAGEEHVCLGLDLCHSYELARRELAAERGRGNDCLAGHEELAVLTAAFLESGMGKEKVKKILGENAFAFLWRALPE